MLKNRNVVVFGGSGFLGQEVVKLLLKEGAVVKIAARYPENADGLKVLANVGQLSFISCNINKESSVREALKNADVAINLVGLLFENAKNNFSSTHEGAAKIIARTAKDLSITQFIHVSALGIDQSKEKSKYAKTKFEAENAIKAIFSEVTIIRPSVIFGEKDNFTKMFAKLFQILPAFPLIGSGASKFQPVYVKDVAQAIVKIVQEEKKFAGKTFELGGPDTISFSEILFMIKKNVGAKIWLYPLSFSLAKFMAFFMQMLPKPLLTVDQVELLKFDNVVKEGNFLNFQHLKIKPQKLADILPNYIKRS